MKEIQLTQGYVALVDDEDFDMLNTFKWCASKSHNNIYASRIIRVGEKRITQRMHWDIMKEKWSDHSDHNGLNNQKYNLRKCTRSQNKMNQRPQLNGTSKYKGVSWFKPSKKWICKIGLNHKDIHIGLFDLEIDAATAYNKKAEELFGEFAYLNVIEYSEKLVKITMIGKITVKNK